MVERGHAVTVYGRSAFVDSRLALYRGVRIRVLPCLRHKYLETVSHTALSILDALFRPYDVVLICNAANAFLAWVPRLAAQKVILNLDGIERRRKKWNLFGKLFSHFSEFLATELPDVAVSDASNIQSYYFSEYGKATRCITYGAPVGRVDSSEVLSRLGLGRNNFLLYVSRLEPENNAHLVIEAYLRSGVTAPLVVVGDAPYGDQYITRLQKLAARGHVLLPGAIYGQGYRELLSHCRCYLHATEVGGTHPALIEAMGAGCVVLVNDTTENREVTDGTGLLYPFNDPEALGQLIARVWSHPEDYEEVRKQARLRVQRNYDWERVVAQYEKLFYELVDRSAW